MFRSVVPCKNGIVKNSHEFCCEFQFSANSEVVHILMFISSLNMKNVEYHTCRIKISKQKHAAKAELIEYGEWTWNSMNTLCL